MRNILLGTNYIHIENFSISIDIEKDIIIKNHRELSMIFNMGYEEIPDLENLNQDIMQSFKKLYHISKIGDQVENDIFDIIPFSFCCKKLVITDNIRKTFKKNIDSIKIVYEIELRWKLNKKIKKKGKL